MRVVAQFGWRVICPRRQGYRRSRRGFELYDARTLLFTLRWLSLLDLSVFLVRAEWCRAWSFTLPSSRTFGEEFNVAVLLVSRDKFELLFFTSNLQRAELVHVIFRVTQVAFLDCGYDDAVLFSEKVVKRARLLTTLSHASGEDLRSSSPLTLATHRLSQDCLRSSHRRMEA